MVCVCRLLENHVESLWNLNHFGIEYFINDGIGVQSLTLKHEYSL